MISNIARFRIWLGFGIGHGRRQAIVVFQDVLGGEFYGCNGSAEHEM